MSGRAHSLRASPYKTQPPSKPADYAGSAQLTAVRPAVCLHRAYRRRFTPIITGRLHQAEKQLAWCHDTPASAPWIADATAEVAAAPAMRAGTVLVHVAGRVGAPVAGEDRGAHRDRRRPPGARRRAETDARSIAEPVPVAAPVLPQFLEDQPPDGCQRPADLPPMARRTTGSWEARRPRLWMPS
jgi:hypothetical protein